VAYFWNNFGKKLQDLAASLPSELFTLHSQRRLYKQGLRVVNRYSSRYDKVSRASFKAESMSENLSAITQVQDADATPEGHINSNRHTGVKFATKAAPNSQTPRSTGFATSPASHYRAWCCGVGGSADKIGHLGDAPSPGGGYACHRRPPISTERWAADESEAGRSEETTPKTYAKGADTLRRQGRGASREGIPSRIGKLPAGGSANHRDSLIPQPTSYYQEGLLP
jgi:hypothetical protein